MKKSLTMVFICISFTTMLAQKKIDGAWEGKLNVGQNSLRILFHFVLQKDGQYTGTMDSPDQGAENIACDNVTLSGDVVTATINSIKGGFTGTLANDSTINGNWEQGGMKIPLSLNKAKIKITIEELNPPPVLSNSSPPLPSIPKENFAGIWEGKLNVGSISLRIVFHFKLQPIDNTYTGTMDSPDQGAKGIHCEKVTIKGDSVIVIVKGKAGFDGKKINDSTLNGNWEQGGKSFPIELKKVISASKNPNRPQTPQPPFSYNSEDIEYDNADKSVHFGATFTWPKGNGPFATAVLITGSGQQDRDETIFGHKSFAVIADYLTKKGIAVLRVDDRGMGKSTGDVQNATSADFAKDVETSLAYLKTRKEVDQKKMGMIGHSEGGLIASIVAAHNPDIDFVIMLAGPGIKGSELLTKQSEDVLLSEGVPAEAAAAYTEMYKIVLVDILSEKDTTVLYNKLFHDFKKWKATQSATILNALKLGADSADDKKIARAFADGFASPWIKYFLLADPRPLMEQFSCKVLALDGSKDIQVNAAINLAAIHDALKKSKSPSFETKELPGLNHLFQHCKKCTVAEYAELEETFAPEALETMWKWLKKNVM